MIEAVFENMDVKKEVFKTLSNTVRPETILASNTSYLNIDELASVVEKPERMLGMHFLARQRHAPPRNSARRKDFARCTGNNS